MFNGMMKSLLSLGTDYKDKAGEMVTIEDIEDTEGSGSDSGSQLAPDRSGSESNSSSPINGRKFGQTRGFLSLTKKGDDDEIIRPSKSRIKRQLLSSDESGDEVEAVSPAKSKRNNRSRVQKASPPKRYKSSKRYVSESDDSFIDDDDSESEEHSDLFAEDEEPTENLLSLVSSDDSNDSRRNQRASKSDEEEEEDDEEEIAKEGDSDDEEGDYEDLISDSSGDEDFEGEREAKKESKVEKSILDVSPKVKPQVDSETRKEVLRAKILSFLDTAPENDLLSVPSVSKKKAKCIMDLRPIVNWMDLVTKLRCDRLLTDDLIDNVKEIVMSRDAIIKLMNECENISVRMSQIVNKLVPLEQPKILNPKMTLANYQLIGLNWLVLMHKERINAILADEMGLGKTIQVIALLAFLRQNLKICGPHLIVVPASTLENWQRELKLWCPKIKCTVYHGPQKDRSLMRSYIRSRKPDVIITTYNLLNNPEDRVFLSRRSFEYVVFDEAHMLKNMKTIRFHNLVNVNARRRILLTGTPVQNNLLELMSLLFFTMPKFFSHQLNHIHNMFCNKEKTSTFEEERVIQAKKILRPFILRRLKVDVLKQLPVKSDIVKLCPMIPEQRVIYDDLIKSYTRDIENESSSDSSKENKDNEVPVRKGAGMLMQLRKAANHPLLMRNLYDDKKLKRMTKDLLKDPSHKHAEFDYVMQDMQVMSDHELHRLCLYYQCLNRYQLTDGDIERSGKFKILDEMLPPLKENNQKVLIFSQFVMMLDIIEDYLKIRKHTFVRLDGSTKISDRMNLIDKFTNDKSIFVFLLSTKAGGLGINLTQANVVIIHDIDFNPYNDKQAEDRCHRLGQDKQVEIFRFISEGSVEQGMIKICEEKLKLGEDIYFQSDAPHRSDSKDIKTLLRKTLGL